MTTLPREWRVPFGTWPAWMCPTCQKSTLNLIADTLKSEETGESKASQTHEAWDPDWTVARFSALFRCANRDCGEVVTCTGNMRVVDDGEDGYEPRYTPLYFHPPLKFFRIVESCPAEVAASVERAFGLAWSDTASAANAMRSSLEALLTERGIARTTLRKKPTGNKRMPLNLQSRIDKYVAKDPEAATLMNALRWLGNNGSHAHGKAPDMADLLNAFAIIEHVIEHIYVQSGKTITKLAKRFVDSKGKPKAKAKNKVKA